MAGLLRRRGTRCPFRFGFFGCCGLLLVLIMLGLALCPLLRLFIIISLMSLPCSSLSPNPPRYDDFGALICETQRQVELLSGDDGIGGIVRMGHVAAFFDVGIKDWHCWVFANSTIMGMIMVAAPIVCGGSRNEGIIM